MNRTVLGLAAFGLILSGVRSAKAGPIPVQNPSFESPPQAKGGYVYAATDWTTTNAGVYRPNIPADVNSVPDGLQVAFAVNGGTLFQDLGVRVDGSLAYELDVFVGTQFFYPAHYLVELTAGGTTIGAASGTLGAIGAFFPVSVLATGSGSGNLGIRLSETSVGQTPVGQTLFDDVRLQSTPSAVPEPSPLIMISLGTAGLIAYGWRRRRLVVV